MAKFLLVLSFLISITRIQCQYLENFSGIPGKAGVDFPVYVEPPSSGFRCDSQPVQGYFADPTSRCQAFNVCHRGKNVGTFLCPNGTVFQQRDLGCHWWYDVDCSQAQSYYVPSNQRVEQEAREVDLRNHALHMQRQGFEKLSQKENLDYSTNRRNYDGSHSPSYTNQGFSTPGGNYFTNSLSTSSPGRYATQNTGIYSNNNQGVKNLSQGGVTFLPHDTTHRYSSNSPNSISNYQFSQNKGNLKTVNGYSTPNNRNDYSNSYSTTPATSGYSFSKGQNLNINPISNNSPQFNVHSSRPTINRGNNINSFTGNSHTTPSVGGFSTPLVPSNYNRQNLAQSTPYSLNKGISFNTTPRPIQSNFQNTPSIGINNTPFNNNNGISDTKFLGQSKQPGYTQRPNFGSTIISSTPSTPLQNKVYSSGNGIGFNNRNRSPGYSENSFNTPGQQNLFSSTPQSLSTSSPFSQGFSSSVAKPGFTSTQKPFSKQITHGYSSPNQDVFSNRPNKILNNNRDYTTNIRGNQGNSNLLHSSTPRISTNTQDNKFTSPIGSTSIPLNNNQGYPKSQVSVNRPNSSGGFPNNLVQPTFGGIPNTVTSKTNRNQGYPSSNSQTIDNINQNKVHPGTQNQPFPSTANTFVNRNQNHGYPSSNVQPIANIKQNQAHPGSQTHYPPSSPIVNKNHGYPSSNIQPPSSNIQPIANIKQNQAHHPGSHTQNFPPSSPIVNKNLGYPSSNIQPIANIKQNQAHPGEQGHTYTSNPAPFVKQNQHLGYPSSSVQPIANIKQNQADPGSQTQNFPPSSPIINKNLGYPSTNVQPIANIKQNQAHPGAQGHTYTSNPTPFVNQNQNQGYPSSNNIRPIDNIKQNQVYPGIQSQRYPSAPFDNRNTNLNQACIAPGFNNIGSGAMPYSGGKTNQGYQYPAPSGTFGDDAVVVEAAVGPRGSQGRPGVNALIDGLNSVHKAGPALGKTSDGYHYNKPKVPFHEGK